MNGGVEILIEKKDADADQRQCPKNRTSTIDVCAHNCVPPESSSLDHRTGLRSAAPRGDGAAARNRSTLVHQTQPEVRARFDESSNPAQTDPRATSALVLSARRAR